MFDRNQLVRECTNLLRVITSKNHGINKEYTEYLKDFDSTIFYDVQILYNEDGTVI